MAGEGLNIKHVFYVLLILAGIIGLGYYEWVYRPAHLSPVGFAYVVSPSLDLLNTFAPVHTTVDILKNGERVAVLRRGGQWDEVRTPRGIVGWTLASQLIEPSVHNAGVRLLQHVASEPVQAVGSTVGMVNVHTAPSLEAPRLTVLSPNAKVDFFERQLVPRSSEAGPSTPSPTDVWYLVKSKDHAGWVLGRLISLDIPQALAPYAASYNLVAWFVLTTVQDHGQAVREYLVADRVGTTTEDFNHIRVFTWSARRHHYVTAFVESNLDGTFPIRVETVNHVPYFWLRLKDRAGHKFQKFYGLFDTIVRPVGTVKGWSSNTLPPRLAER